MVDVHRDPADLRFQDLFDEAVRLAQRRQWPSGQDPKDLGSTALAVLEAAAMIADQVAFRITQLPRLLRGPLLELLDLRPAPTRAATTSLEFRLELPVTEPVVVARGTRVTTRGGATVFSTVRDLRLGPATVVTQFPNRPHDDGAPTRVLTSADLDRLDAMFAEPPQPGDTYLVGLETPLPGCLIEVSIEVTPLEHGALPKLPPMVWECWVGEEWANCVVVESRWTGSTSTVILLHVPDEHAESVFRGHRAAWLRCRVVEPETDRPELRVSPVAGDITVATVGGVVEARHGILVVDEPLGTASSVPGERFRLRHQAVLADPPPLVQVGNEDGWDAWTVVPTFIHSGPSDRHVRVDHAAGVVEFGPWLKDLDGFEEQKGAMPPDGALVRVREYWVGGGSAGNVPAGTLDTIAEPVLLTGVTVTNPLPAGGGFDAESLDSVWARAPFALRARDRAVTAADYEYLAKEIAPDLARVHCMSDDDGAVRVLCVPFAAEDQLGQLRFADLMLTRELLDRVFGHLEERRVIGTRVVIAPPRYLGVTVVARVVRTPGRSGGKVRDDALRALNSYLHPITGGPNRTGWPFGRPVHIGDIFAVLQQVDGVDRVSDARLFAADPVTSERGDATNVVEVEPGGLVVSFEHHVRVES